MPVDSRWTLPIPSQTLPTFVFGSPDAPLPDAPVFIDADNTSRHLTVASYRALAKRFAAGLIAAGLQPGDAVVLYSGNTIYFPVVFMGTIMAGGIFSGANPTYVPREVGFQLENTGAKFFVCAEGSLATGLEAAQIAKLPKDQMFVFDDGVDTFNETSRDVAGCRHWTRLLTTPEQGEAFRWRESEDMLDEVICLNYSSGTTGLPKGVMITHRNYVANSIQHFHLTTLIPDFETKLPAMRWLCFLPMYHALAQTVFGVTAPAQRVPVYVMRRFEFSRMLQHLQSYRITDLQLVPPICVAMAKSPETRQYDLSSIERAGCGAAPLGKEASQEFNRLWPDGVMNLKQGWGMTEVTCSALGWDPAHKSFSYGVGEPNANVSVKLMDPETASAEVAHGERGEIWVKGPNIMKGYWKNEAATRETLMPDGWLRTGDIAYRDDEGVYFVVDRMKELIKVRGLQVAPAELEAQLLDHASISDACVVGVNVKGDELPRAYIVTPNNDVDPKEVAEWFKSRVSKHKQLTGGVKIVDSIQKNPSGKILRKVYRELAKEEVGDTVAPETKL